MEKTKSVTKQPLTVTRASKAMDDTAQARIDMDVARARRLLQLALKCRGLSQRSLEKQMGFSARSGYLSRIFGGSRTLRLRNILEILQAAGIPAGSFFRGLFPSASRENPARSIERALAEQSLSEQAPQPAKPEWLCPGIRYASLADISSLQQLCARLPEVGFARDFVNQEDLEDLLLSQRGIALVAVEGVELVGFLYAGIQDRTAALWYYGVSPSHQKRFGEALHDAYLTALRHLGISHAGAFVSFEGQAREIMSRRGYQRRRTFMWMERMLTTDRDAESGG